MGRGEPRLSLLPLVLVGAFDQALHGLGGDGCPAAQMEVEVQQNGPQRASTSASTVASAAAGSAAFSSAARTYSLTGCSPAST
jgi:hypothetical protein